MAQVESIPARVLVIDDDEVLSGLHPNPWGSLSTLMPPPSNCEQTGLNNQMLQDLATKYLYHFRRRTAFQLCDGLKLPYAVIEEVLEELKREGLATVSGAHGLGPGSYEYVLSDAGRERAVEAISRNSYYGPAPVPFEQYLEVVRGSMFARQFVPQAAITRLTNDLVLSELDHFHDKQRANSKSLGLTSFSNN
jgi:hypothetical protein